MSNEAALQLAHLRWKGTTAEQRSAHAVVMNAGKRLSMTKKQISAQARAAANARWKRVKEAGSRGVRESGRGAEVGRRAA